MFSTGIDIKKAHDIAKILLKRNDSYKNSEEFKNFVYEGDFDSLNIKACISSFFQTHKLLRFWKRNTADLKSPLFFVLCIIFFVIASGAKRSAAISKLYKEDDQ